MKQRKVLLKLYFGNKGCRCGRLQTCKLDLRINSAQKLFSAACIDIVGYRPWQLLVAVEAAVQPKAASTFSQNLFHPCAPSCGSGASIPGCVAKIVCSSSVTAMWSALFWKRNRSATCKGSTMVKYCNAKNKPSWMRHPGCRRDGRSRDSCAVNGLYRESHPYCRPAKLGKLEGANYQHTICSGPQKVYFDSMWRFRCSVEEILERQLLARRPVTSLRQQERRRVFWEGPNFFELCPVLLNYV